MPVELYLESVISMVEVAPVTKEIRKSHFRWFDHIKYRPSDDPIRTVDVLDSGYVKRGRGRYY
ncbi:hypothetical protein IEQ34_017489 [Dendrobium chrysotoxum]|uniref:Uncharacterized protein n=1 Tax=Dendrobium chrysotoxum TaxID=161865 RepID=A0AAV7FTY0_DENCH|nr:hypothetical protein IEQ34_017489 [Dendrobium chrysotoxum]